MPRPSPADIDPAGVVDLRPREPDRAVDVVVERPPEPDRSRGQAQPSAIDGVRSLLVVLLACAGAIHLAMAPVHAPSSSRQAVAFAITGAIQLVAGSAAAVSLRRWPVAGGALLGAAAVGAWAWSRWRALPLGLGGPEEAGVVDGLCVALEVVAVALAVVVLRRGAGQSELSVRAVVPLQGVALLATVVVLASPSTAQHGHHHDDSERAGAGSHDHGAVPAAGGEPCPEAGGGPVTHPSLTFPAPRLSDDQAAPLHALSEASGPLECGTLAASHEHGHGSATPPRYSPLEGTELTRFDAQWSAAVSAAAVLATPDQAAAAGYVKASPHAAGVGSHWINWALLDAPFDAARPSMLLFDERATRGPHLVGFSYWTRSAPGAPDGFAGPNDIWHRHFGLCFVDGWLFREAMASADGCGGGEWLNGSNLWMLHAWVVPAAPNPDGPFAGRNPNLCPGDREQIADALTCDPNGH